MNRKKHTITLTKDKIYKKILKLGKSLLGIKTMKRHVFMKSVKTK